MEAAVLTKLLGREQHWHGPCTILVASEASVQLGGTDAVGGGGAKTYAPRVVSGRVQADSVCVLHDGSALIALQQQKSRQATGEETIRHQMTVLSSAHVVGLEFPDAVLLSALGVTTTPTPIPAARSSSGLHKRPQIP
jgi:hypothetical protein